MKYLFFLISLLLSSQTHAQKRSINVDGTKIWIHSNGLENRVEGQPVIVFESGYGTDMNHWDTVWEGVSELGPWISYDRPGIGKSQPVEEMPTLKNVSDRLIRILNHLDLEPPYLLVGHSLGGLYIRGFARYYPEVLAGLIFVDPADFTETHQNKRVYYEVLNWEEQRVDSLIQHFIDKRKSRRGKVPPSMLKEGQVLEEVREKEFAEVRTHALPNIPVHILTGGKFDKPIKMRSKAYDEEALFRSKLRHRVSRWTDVIQSVDKGKLFYGADAGHFVHRDDPDLLISSIRIALKDYELLRQKKK